MQSEGASAETGIVRGMKEPFRSRIGNVLYAPHVSFRPRRRPVRFATAQRRRSRAWWGVIIVALLTIGAYVIFDILDVDGSQMTGWPADDIIVAEALQVEADRFFRADSFTPDSTGLLYLSLSRSSTNSEGGPSPVTSLFRVRQSRMLPRVNLRRELVQTSSRSVDPA